MIFILLCSIGLARAALDPLTGARVSLASTQQLLASPFLPNLKSDRGHIGVQASYLGAQLRGIDQDALYNGDFSGYGVGINYSTALARDLGYFLTGVYSKSEGSAAFASAVNPAQHRFSTSGTVVNVGANLRLLGRDESASIVGVFGGPALMQFDSELRIGQELYTSSPLIYGVTVGAQWRVWAGNFVFNPYGLRFQAFTDACTGVSTVGVVSFPDHCPGDNTKVALMPSFSAYGLVFGYRRLEANVYAKLINSSVTPDIKVFTLGLSYTFAAR